MDEASAVDPGPPSNGLRGMVALTAAIVAAPLTNFRRLILDFLVLEVVGSIFSLSMRLLPNWFDQLRWASASDLIARVREHPNDVGIARSKCVLNVRMKRHLSEQRFSALLKSKTVMSILRRQNWSCDQSC